MMQTLCDNTAKYLVYWFVSFRKHFSETDTFFCFLLYYVERWDFQDFKNNSVLIKLKVFLLKNHFYGMNE